MKLKFSLSLPGAKHGRVAAQTECELSDTHWPEKLAEMAENAGEITAGEQLEQHIKHIARLDRSLLNDFMEAI